MKRSSLLLTLLFCLNIQAVQADVVVRMSLQQGLQQNNVDIRLFDQFAPLTVANFLKYSNGTTTNGGSYDNTVIHRSIANFVVQGGGYSFNPYVTVVRDDPVTNEFTLPNVRGTIAMAKVSSGPDPVNSATSEWFFNLVDNSSNLDNQNGGFTVFGAVIGNGMDVVDAIANLPVFNKTALNTAFASLPLIDYTEPDAVTPDNLVRLNSVTQLFSISENYNFGLVATGASAQTVVTIENTSTGSIAIADMASTNPLLTPFTIMSDTCSNTTLIVAASCDITVDYSPQLVGSSQDSFNIEFTTPVISFEYAVGGEAVEAIVPDISPSLSETIGSPSISSIDYGVVQLYNPEIDPIGDYVVLYIYNEGLAELNISSVTLDGPADFEFIDNCTAFSPIVPGGFCVMPVFFKPTSGGEKSATLTIISDDPDENPLIIPISGIAELDNDNIAASIEDSAPNNGDGNMDNIADSIQSNVSSFLSLNNSYITLLTYSGAALRSTTVLDNSAFAPVPENINFPLGIFDFETALPFAGVAVDVGLILPAGVIPQTYYMYGPTPDDINPHWYEFMYDESTETGAIIFGDVSFTSPADGSQVTRSVITLVLKDGARGDADLLANGIVAVSGSPVTANSQSSGSSSSGSLGIYMLFGLMLAVLTRVQLRRIP